MKRFSFGIFIGLFLGLLIFGSLSFASSPIKLIVDGTEVNPDVPPQIIDGRTMVPVRFVAENLGLSIGWNGNRNAVIIDSNSNNRSSEEEQDVEKSVNNSPNHIEKEAPTASIVSLGETVEHDGIKVKVTEVDYVDTGFNIYFSVENESEEPLQGAGKFQFTISPSKFEDELNRKGYTHHFDSSGYIYPGEKRTGHYQYIYDRDIKIEKVSYHLQKSSILSSKVGTWTID